VPIAKLLGPVLIPLLQLVTKVIEKQAPALLSVVKAYGQLLLAVLPLLPPLFRMGNDILPALTPPLRILAWTLSTIVVPILKTWLGWLTNIVRWISNIFVPGLKGDWEAIKAITVLVWGAIVRFFKGIPGDITHALSPLFDVGKTAIQNLWNGMKSVASGLRSWFSNLLHTLTGGLLGSSSGGNSPGPSGGQPAANAALARRMVPAWSGGANWSAWNNVAMRESGWNQFARNPTSGAYGIPQALPPTKMPFAAQAAGGSQPGAQIAWMAFYMRNRYGGPQGAWAHEQQFGWYDQGGWLPPGVSMALNTTGRPERVGGGCDVININIYPPVTSNPRDIARQIVNILNQGATAGIRLRPSIIGTAG
jgi:hypothetical protein